MPWSKETLQEDVTFMMGVIGKAEKPEISEKLNYRPDMRILTLWLRNLLLQFRIQMQIHGGKQF